MRRISLALAFAICFALAGCDNEGSTKIGVVDLNRLMSESAPGKAGLKFIESQQKELQAKLDAIQERIEKNPADEAAMQELQTVYAASQQKIQTEGQAVVTRLLESIQDTVDTFRKDKGFSILIRKEALDSLDPALDVTTEIMAEVDKLKLDFSQALPAAKQEPEQKGAVEDERQPAQANADQDK